MATNRIHTITTDDGTRINITVDGRNLRIDGDASTPRTARPVEHWELRQELDGVRLLVIGWGMAAAGFSALALLMNGLCLLFGR